MSAITVRYAHPSEVFQGDFELLLKATKLVQKWIPQYQRADGTFVAAHHKLVHEADDHDPGKILAGQGTYSQKTAHKQLVKQPWFQAQPDEHKVLHIQAHATDLQHADSMKAQLAVMKKNALAGKAPTPAQLKFYAALPESDAVAIVSALKDKGAPAQVLQTLIAQHPAGAAAMKARATPAASPAPVPDPAPAVASPAEPAAAPVIEHKPFDHGELNIPGKTNTIDAELDKYKAQEAAKAKAEAKVASAQKKSDKAQAKELHAQLAEAIIAKMAPGIAAKQGLTEAQARKTIASTLDDLVKWQPKQFLMLAAKFQAEQAKAAAAVSPPAAPTPAASEPKAPAAAAAPAGEVALPVFLHQWSSYKYEGGGFDKYWGAAVVDAPGGGSMLIVRSGKIGKAATTETQHFDSEVDAKAAKSALIAKKKAAGFVWSGVQNHPGLTAPVMVPAPAPAAAAAPVAAAPAPSPAAPSADAWEKVGGQLGSNSGFVAIDPDGQKWYVKTPNSEAHTKSELLAAKLYALAGVKAAQLKPVTVGGKLSIASKWEDNTAKAGPGAHVALDGAREGFAVDAWLANWDALGVDSTNIQSVAGKASRIDVGGSLEFRAQGAPKGDAFGTSVPELATMRDAAKNAQTAAVFGGMTDAQVAKSIRDHVAKVTDDAIINAVREMGPGSGGARAALAQKLIARRQYLLGWASQHAPKATAAPAPAAAGPKDGDTKQGAGGTLTLKDGRWHKLVDAEPVAIKPLSMPEFAEGKTTKGVVAYYEKAAKQVMNLAESGDVHALAALKNPAGKSWQGKTPNSKKLIALHDEAMSLAQAVKGKAAAPGPASPPEPAAVRPQKVIGAVAAGAAPASPSAIKAALADIEAALLPSSNTNHGPVNKKLMAMHSAARAGNLAQLHAMTFGSNTYGKKQAKLHAALVAAMGATPPAAPAPATKKVKGAKLKGDASWVKLATGEKVIDAGRDFGVDWATVEVPAKGHDPDAFPPMPIFNKSSKTHINVANAVLAAEILDEAKAGKLTAAQLKAKTFDAIAKETGKPTGAKVSVFSHPSSQINELVTQVAAELEAQQHPTQKVVHNGSIVGGYSKAMAGIAAKVKVVAYEKFKSWAHKAADYLVLDKAAGAILAVPPADQFKETDGETGAMAAFKAKSNAAFTKLAEPLRQALKQYTGSAYHDWNRAMRKGELESSHWDSSKNLRAAFDACAQELPEGIILWRGIGVGGDTYGAVVGGVIQDGSVQSCSYGDSPAFSSKETLLRIHVPAGVRAVHATSFSVFGKGEREVILDRQVRYAVVKVTKHDNFKPDGSSKTFGKKTVVDLIALPHA